MRKMLQAGLKATMNSDDPAYFGGYMNENYLQLTEALNLSRDEIATLARNGFAAAFISDEQKQVLLDKLEAYVATA